ncbi:hypothetical protein HT102_01575 [Hoyosella sp. G463]|uniref:Uncharacterized protein n=1 Tax=Lolliginicoccus lacisalsi TaxID=2742202 RepID=A0A927J9T1_9ACTN|nr:hypothetical protein [Lolliginicoccus lacisalsi]MBD8505180.1 hypothetical protein [Lolliginicoccus lacisalsi]
MPLARLMAREDTASGRMTRVLGFALGFAGAAFLGIEFPAILEQMAGNPWWWLLPAIIAIPGMYAAMIIASVWGSARAVRLICGTYPVLYIPVIAALPLAFEPHQLPPITMPWPLLIGSGTIITASFVLPLRRLVPIAVIYAALHAIDTYWAQDGVPVDWAIREGISIAMIGVIFAAMIRSVQANAALIDSESEVLRARAGERVRETAINQERDRLDALVHDTIVSTFVAACTGAPAHKVRESALGSLETLDSLARSDSDTEPVIAREAIARLRQIVGDVREDFAFHASVDDVGATYPLEVVRMLQEVIAEAARNSIRHAGQDARRGLLVRCGSGSIFAMLADNGRGFDPARVPPRRLGIHTAMRGRVALIEGAGLEIDSAPGEGTTVTVTWSGNDD